MPRNIKYVSARVRVQIKICGQSIVDERIRPSQKKKIIISFYSTQRKRKIILPSSSSSSARKCSTRWSTIFFMVKITFECSNIVMYTYTCIQFDISLYYFHYQGSMVCVCVYWCDYANKRRTTMNIKYLSDCGVQYL